MKYIEVLTQEAANANTFVINNGFDSVAVTAGNGKVTNAEGYKYFKAGDNVNILSMGFYIPMGFDIYGTNENIKFSINGYNTLGIISFLMLPGIFTIPFSNYEMATGVFTLGVSQKIQLAHSIFNSLNISMIGVPAALNTKTFKIFSFFKVEHTLPMEN